MSKYEPVNPYSASSVLKRQGEKNRNSPHSSVFINNERYRSHSHSAHSAHSDLTQAVPESLIASFTGFLVNGPERQQEEKKNDGSGGHLPMKRLEDRSFSDSQSLQTNLANGTNSENFPLNKQEGSILSETVASEGIASTAKTSFTLDTSYMGKVDVSVEHSALGVRLVLSSTLQLDEKGARVLSGIVKTQLKQVLGRNVEVLIVNA